MMLGLGVTDIVQGIAQAIYRMEGNSATSIATRNNNPGNLRSGAGQTGTSGGYAVFPDMATGWNALYNQINLNISRGLTLYEFFAGKPGVYPGYAPSTDSNDPVNYANFVAAQTGIDPNVPLYQLASGGGVGMPLPFDPNSGTSIDLGDNTGLFGMDSNTTVLMGAAVALVLIVGLTR